MKQSSNIIIRPAKSEDAQAAVPLIYSSGPDAWSYVFQEGKLSPQDFLTRSFQGTKNTISYKNHFVAEKNGEIVGTIVVYTSDRFFFLNAGTAGNIFRIYGLRGIKVALRGLSMEGMIQPPKSGRLYLGHIAVPVHQRKQGIGEALMRHAVSAFPNYSKISLDVSQVNPGAIGLYNKLGFKIVESRKFAGPKGLVPDHHYMEADRSSF
ncbi:GNAT family N-acetyltransferase [Leptospira langatensis]|uniref:GNAT family N-acetyltransferase n=1 Tax=Leptospira langatensis TaxID=2484983 RepID=A0A5F1ZQN3_9LEPT|nr:GNAT family N-acetyltransferase [Leptospira langatensis]TGK05250.1 GNAT family N-acetyltransferase [Leptospira langatensis]TGL38386.1 GNAT family N-acetyltransferase [Leptospira langatensis]